MNGIATNPESFKALLLSGHAAVVEKASLLEKLAERHGQAGAMSWLAHFLTRPLFWGKKPYRVFWRKKPCLVLIVNAGATESSLQVEDVRGAVLLFEYRVLGLPTRSFSTDDWGGFRTVIAPEAERGVVASMAADALFDVGAQTVVISYGNPSRLRNTSNPSLHNGTRWAWQTRQRAMVLPLESTYKATLAKFGKSTRFNLGYYRRRVEATVPSEFVADARGLIHEREMEALNTGSLNPTSLSEFRLQYDSSCNLPGGFLVGLRTTQGKWLSLIGGWRQADVTVLCWQMNTAGFEKLSLGTAMRSYFLEHEISLGAKTLIIYGGTSHTMVHSFLSEEVTDLIIQRRSWHATALYIAARLLASPLCPFRVHSLLMQTITNKKLDWYSGEEQVASPKQKVHPSKIL